MKTQSNSIALEISSRLIKRTFIPALGLLFASPMMLRGAELLLNGSFDDNTTWTVVPAESVSWTCIANGEANLHPVVPTPPYIGPVITQGLSLSNAGGLKLHFAAVMSSPFHPPGNTIAFQLEYLDSTDTTKQLTIVNPDNNSITNLTDVAADVVLPLDAKTLTKFLVTKASDGMFTLQSVSLDLLAPLLSITAPASGAEIPSGEPVEITVALDPQVTNGLRTVEIREDGNVIGQASPDAYNYGWKFPDGGNLNFNSATQIVYIHADEYFFFDGTFPSPGHFTGTFSAHNIGGMFTGNGSLDFSFDASGQLTVATSGDAPLGIRSITGGKSTTCLSYRMTWDNAPAGPHSLTAVMTHEDSTTSVTEILASTSVSFTVLAPVTVPEIAVESSLGTNITDGVGIRSFGNVPVGSTSAPKVFTIKNVGTASLTGLAITKDGANPGNFTVSTLPKTTLTPGTSTTFSVTFVPSAGSAQTASLHIASNDADENPFDINLAGNGTLLPEIAVQYPLGTDLTDNTGSTSFGNVPVGTNSSVKTFTIRNEGLANLTGLAIRKNGTQASDFTVGALDKTTLAAGESTAFTVILKPAAAGLRNAAIHIASNDTNENPFDINLTGTGVLVPEIVVEQPAGSSLVDGTAKKSFGTVVVGKTGSPKTFTIKNTGTANLTGLAITKNGANTANFIVSALSTTSLAPGTSTSFQVAFKPNATGTRTATIHIASNDANENPFDIQLSGFGAAP